MQTIITLLTALVIMLGSVSAMSIMDAVQVPNAQGLTVCRDDKASNEGALAPCLYILERKSTPVYTTNNNQPNLYARVNPFIAGQLNQLIDTSNINYNTQLNNNYNNGYNYNGNNYNYNDYNNTSNNYNSNYVDTSTQAPIYNTNSSSITTNTTTMVSLAAGSSSLPDWFRYGFSSIRKIGNITLYSRNGQHVAIDHTRNLIGFTTQPDQQIVDSWTSNTHTVIITAPANNQYNNTNNTTAYLINNDQLTTINNLNMVVLLAANNNPRNKDVMIVASLSNQTYTYVVLDYAGTTLTSGTSSANRNDLIAAATSNSNNNYNSNNYNNNNQYYNNSNNQYYNGNNYNNSNNNQYFNNANNYNNYNNNYNNTNANNNYYYRPPAAVTTNTPVAPLTYNINYKLGTKYSDGSYKLDDVSCATNGSVDLLWIEKLLKADYYGVGIEINNTFGNQTHKINKGDRLCCKVISTRGTYQQAGGCTIVK